MSGLTIGQFIERLRNDEELRQRLLDAESAAARTISGGIDAITQIAAQEGFDITGWPGRPITELTPKMESDLSTCCVLTCCLLSTSVAVVQEEDMDRYRR
jgi:Nif11 domain